MIPCAFAAMPEKPMHVEETTPDNYACSSLSGVSRAHCLAQAALEDTVLDAVLACAFDAPPEKLEAARKPLKASLHAMALKAARLALHIPALQCP